MLLKRLVFRPLVCLLALSGATATTASWADPVAAVQLLRASGCGGALPAFDPLQRSPQLDRAATLWASGGSLLSAAGRSGYSAQRAVGLRLSGPDDSILQALRRTHCRPLADRALRDIGAYQRGAQTWVVIASPGRDAAASGPAQTPVPARRVLLLVNEVRARGAQCGGKAFGPAPALQLSGTLASVALEHAMDMARHGYFEHVDLGGRTPADRVRATGYRERLVGENIAYGAASADEVVAGWLHSAGHCENIMDPRFVEMGLASAPGRDSRRGLYWDQVLAQPLK
jgi:uncharacterized protein YkwD